MAYKDPDYDPVKAHEYYMRHRKLKGRRSQRKFTQQQKEQYAYVSDQLREQRRKTVSEGIAKENEGKKQTLEQIRKTRDSQKELLRKNAKKKMELIRVRLKYMSSDQKQMMASKINSMIDKIHERVEVMSETFSDQANSKMDKVRQTAKENKSAIRKKAKEDYEIALDAAYKRIKG